MRIFSSRSAVRFLVVLFLALSATLPSLPADAGWTARLPELDNPSDPDQHPPRRFSRFSLENSRGLGELRAALTDLLTLEKAQKKAKKERKGKVGRVTFPLEIKGGQRMAFERALELIPAAERGDEAARFEIAELLGAWANGHEYPIKKHYQLIPEAPIYLIRGTRHQTVRSDGSDSRREPKPSSYWQPVANDGTVDMYHGFGRTSLIDADSAPCTYKEPKTSWGAHPGFRVVCGGKTIKFKLGDEIYGGPFNTRLFWVLGYNVEAIDSVKELKVSYDRRLLEEFNSRKHLEFTVRFLFFKLYKNVITNYEDPFTFIKHAVMKDGTIVPAREIKKRLFKRIPDGDPQTPDYERPEKIAGNYREEVERNIDYLAFVPGTFEEDNDGIKSIGPWKYEEFGADERREVRAIQLVSAWTDEYNMRWENTTLAWVQENGAWKKKHMLSDVGSGFGGATSIVHMKNSRLERFLWRVTEPREGGAVKLSHFMQNMKNSALDNMSLEDARWILRKMARLTEKQIRDMLRATHMKPAEQETTFRKLWSRRAHMIRDFGLAGEFPEQAKGAR